MIKKVLTLLIVSSIIMTFTTACSASVIKIGKGKFDTSIKNSENVEVKVKTETNVKFADNEYSRASITLDILSEEDNVIISPLSINAAFAMIYNGAEDKTKREIATYFGEAGTSTINDKYTKLLDSFKSDKSSDEQKVYSANSFWYNRTYKVKDEFRSILENQYSAEIQDVDFTNKTTVNKINAWVSKNTEKNINEIVKELDSRTASVLINTLFFKSEWADQFSEYNVDKKDFTNLDGSKSQVDMMMSVEGTYLENNFATGFMKPYYDGRYAFVGILPKEEGTYKVHNLDIASLMASASNRYDVNISLPKFKMEYDTSLVQTLSELGIQDIFDAKLANLNGVFDDAKENIYVSDVIHKATIDVDEKGTTASAATAMVMMESSMMINPPEKKDVHLDRPFVFMIVDTKSNYPLFIGKVNNL